MGEPHTRGRHARRTRRRTVHGALSIDLHLKISNDGARAAHGELRAFLLHVNQKAATVRGDRPNPQPMRAYTVLKDIADRLERELSRLGS